MPGPSAPDICADWCSVDDVLDLGPVDASEAEISKWIRFASLWLYRHTMRQWPGTCEITIRPVRPRDCTCLTAAAWWAEYGWWATPWWQWDDPLARCLRCADKPLGDVDELRIPGPVGDIAAIVIDGETLPATAYTVTNRRKLIRVDGGKWPHGNDLTRDPSDPAPADSDTPAWQVTYDWGSPPPPDGAIAAAVLAREFVLAACNSGACRLPANLTQLSRQGERMEFEPLSSALAQGRTGLMEVDMFVSSVNPRGKTRRPKAYRHYERPNRTIWS